VGSCGYIAAAVAGDCKVFVPTSCQAFKRFAIRDRSSPLQLCSSTVPEIEGGVELIRPSELAPEESNV
jgi:hypothetical protein